jgi:hypothetical protein
MVALMACVQTRVHDIERTVLTLLEARADSFLELDRSEIGRAFMREKRAFFRRQLPTVRRETKGSE